MKKIQCLLGGCLLAAVGVNASLIIDATAPTADNPLSQAVGGGFTAIKHNEMRGQTFLMPATGVSGKSQWSMTTLTLRTAQTAYAYEAGDQLELFVFAWNPSTDGNDVTEWSKGDGTSDGDPLNGTGMSLLFSQRYDLPTTSVAVGSYLHFNLETPVVLSENTTYGFAINLKDVVGGSVNNTMRLATGGDPNNVYSDGRLLITDSTNKNNANVDMTFYVTATAIPEPATIGMLGIGAIITLMIRRRSRS